MKTLDRGGYAWMGVTVLLAVAVTGCGGTVPSQPGAAPFAVRTPTAAEMNAWLNRAIDPEVPSVAKQSLVQGSVADPGLVSKVLSMYTAEGAKLAVKQVSPRDSQSILVSADLSLWQKNYPQQVPFVFEDDQWKIDKQYACRVVALLQLSSNACL